MRDARKRSPWHDGFSVPLWARLFLLIHWPERRVGDRRAYPWSCTRGCGPDHLRTIGSRTIGVRIVKCMQCGNMDRRLLDHQGDRRTNPWLPREPESLGVAWARLYVAVVVAAVAAFLGLRVLSW